MTIPAIPQMSSQERKEAAQKAASEVERRLRQGEWAGGVVAHTEYQRRPLEWMVEKLKIPENSIRWSLNPGYEKHEWDGDPDPLVTILEALAENRDAGAESATGTGKTYLAAAITLWFLASFEDARVITVAPKEDQLLKQIWMEIGGLFPAFQKEFPNAVLLPGSGILRMRPQEGDQEKWAATAFVCGVGATEDIAGKAKGFHAQHMLIISEETQSIDPAVMKAFSHTRTADHNRHMALGNPDHLLDQLHEFCEKPSTVNVRISAFDHPNIVSGFDIVPAAIGRIRLKEREEDCAPPDSRMYLSQIRGICPKQSSESLIRWEWCEAAAARWGDPELRKGLLALGADVADSPTGDKASISRWQGACCTEVISFNVRDASEVADRIYLEAMNAENPVEPKYIGIDAVGVGASTVNTLKRMGMRVRTISGGMTAVPQLDQEARWDSTKTDEDSGRQKPTGPRVVESELYDNLRSQIWWRLREDLRLGRIALPNDPELFRDLTMPTYKQPNKIVVESKDTIRKNLGRSPDKGDAVAYGNWVRRRIPVKVTPIDTIESGPNRDTGLEKILATNRKQMRIMERQAAKTLAKLRRDRRRMQ